MGLGQQAILNLIYNDTTTYNSVLSEIDNLNAEKSDVNLEQNATENKLTAKYSENNLLKQQDNLQTNQLEEYHALLKETIENEDPMNKMYCGIKEFVIEEASMCGMGMGMGSLQLNSNLQLTGKELVAMDQVLNGNSDGAMGVNCLVDKLHEMGIENAQVSKDGSEIELTRVDENGNETKVKFKDANGDGMLNGCDYDFSDALAKFNADLKAYNEKVTTLENNIETTANQLQATKAAENSVSNDIKALEETKQAQKDKLSSIDNKIKENEAKAKEFEKNIAGLNQQYEETKNEAEIEEENQEQKLEKDEEEDT